MFYVGHTYISSLPAFSPLSLETAAQIDIWGIALTMSFIFYILRLGHPGALLTLEGLSLPGLANSQSAQRVCFSNVNQPIQSPHQPPPAPALTLQATICLP